MKGKVVIRQLWDEEKEKTPTVEDIDKKLLTNKQVWKYNRKNYVTYENREGEKPYENSGKVTWKNLTEEGQYRLPIKFINKADGTRKRKVDRPKLLHNMFQLKEKFNKLGGEGYYNIYIIGGQNPPIQYILQRWISQVDSN